MTYGSDEHIADLQRQLADSERIRAAEKQILREEIEAHVVAKVKLADAAAQIGAAVEALRRLLWKNKHGEWFVATDEPAIDQAGLVLDNLATAARQHDARVRRGSIEEVVQIIQRTYTPSKQVLLDLIDQRNPCAGRVGESRMNCKWKIAWVGSCGKSLSDGSEFCADHQKACASCGAPATHDCYETGQFVCGAPLCGGCEHTIFPNGTNGGIGFNALPVPEGMGTHCRKSEQRFKPWYARTDDERAIDAAMDADPAKGAR